MLDKAMRSGHSGAGQALNYALAQLEAIYLQRLSNIEFETPLPCHACRALAGSIALAIAIASIARTAQACMQDSKDHRVGDRKGLE